MAHNDAYPLYVAGEVPRRSFTSAHTVRQNFEQRRLTATTADIAIRD